MAQEIVTWCDKHLDLDKRVPGETHTITIDGQTWQADTCRDCWAELSFALTNFLMESGRSENKKPPSLSPGTFTCPECGHTYTFRSSLTNHVRDTHGTFLALLEGRKGKDVNGHPIIWQCLECQAGWTSAQGASQHKRLMGCTGEVVKL